MVSAPSSRVSVAGSELRRPGVTVTGRRSSGERSALLRRFHSRVPEGEVEVGAAGLLAQGPRLALQPAHSGAVRVADEVGVQLAPGDALGQHVSGSSRGASSVPRSRCDRVEVVGRSQGEPTAAVQHVLDLREPALGDVEAGDARPGRQVDQLVAQAEVEQGVLPALDARRRPPDAAGAASRRRSRALARVADVAVVRPELPEPGR